MSNPTDSIDRLTTALNSLFTAGRIYGKDAVSPDDWAREIGMTTDIIESLIQAARADELRTLVEDNAEADDLAMAVLARLEALNNIGDK